MGDSCWIHLSCHCCQPLSLGPSELCHVGHKSVIFQGSARLCLKAATEHPRQTATCPSFWLFPSCSDFNKCHTSQARGLTSWLATKGAGWYNWNDGGVHFLWGKLWPMGDKRKERAACCPAISPLGLLCLCCQGNTVDGWCQAVNFIWQKAGHHVVLLIVVRDTQRIIRLQRLRISVLEMNHWPSASLRWFTTQKILSGNC